MYDNEGIPWGWNGVGRFYPTQWYQRYPSAFLISGWWGIWGRDLLGTQTPNIMCVSYRSQLSVNHTWEFHVNSPLYFRQGVSYVTEKPGPLLCGCALRLSSVYILLVLLHFPHRVWFTESPCHFPPSADKCENHLRV